MCFRPFYRAAQENGRVAGRRMLGNAHGDAASPRLGAPRSVTGLGLSLVGKSPDATAARLAALKWTTAELLRRKHYPYKRPPRSPRRRPPT